MWRTCARYHIRPGTLSDRTFLSELADRAKERLEFRTQEIQTNVGRFAELPEQFAAFARTLMESNGLGTLVIVLNALDELRRPESDTTALITDLLITDFLPPVEDLPDRCFVVLTSRESVHQRVEQSLPAAATASNEAIVILRGLVERGRAELANDLATALMNKGVVLDSLGQLPAAVTA